MRVMIRMSEEEISPENLKKGMLWHKPLTPEMNEYREITGGFPVFHSKITGMFEKWLWKKGYKTGNYSNPRRSSATEEEAQMALNALSHGEIGQEYIEILKFWYDRKTVNDFLALSPLSDPFYASKHNKEMAKWFLDVWTKEGKRIIHPRGVHYIILGKNYMFTFQAPGKTEVTIQPYQASYKSYLYLMTACKWARYYKLINYNKILDNKNPDPIIGYREIKKHKEFNKQRFRPFNGITEYTAPSIIDWDIDDFIDSYVSDAIRKLFVYVKPGFGIVKPEPVEYSHIREQPNYIELWAEKGGVIPSDVAWEFDTTQRWTKSGEFSVKMCSEAIRRAQKFKKTLHIFMIHDFDMKGVDMSKSVARKIELICRQKNVTAFVHDVCLNKEQCDKYDLPLAIPTSESEGYLTQYRMFKEKYGREPSEVNSFQDLYPEEYKETIREAIIPYYDTELEGKIEIAKKELKNKLKSKIREKIEERQDQISELRKILKPKFETLNKELDVLFNEKKKELGIDKIIDNYKNILKIDLENDLKDIKIDMPKAEVSEPPKDILLDTRRSYLEQIKWYKKYDMRYELSKDV